MAAVTSDNDLRHRREQGAVRINIRLIPKARCSGISGEALDENGTRYLKVSVTAVPAGDKANRAMIKLLAKEWQLPKSTFSIIQGTTDRRKVIEICGDMDMVQSKITAWMNTNLRETNG